MIQVNITKSDNQITAVFHGHAGHDKIGKDIVCAGVSALFYALVLGVNKIAPENSHCVRHNDNNIEYYQ